MATNLLLSNIEFKKEPHDTDRYKVNQLARLLSGYDDETWESLSRPRRLTYVRAATTLYCDWPTFKIQMKEFGEEDRLGA